MNPNNEEKANDKFIIGPWTVMLESGILSNGNGEEIYLELRLAKLFYILGENLNQLVPRKQLIDQIWFDTIVNDESLTKAVSDLRKVLNTHFDTPPQIKTIPKRGYKMIISKADVKRPTWKSVLKYIAFSILLLILLLLVIRGLNY